jgi:O-antigen/teichoic acid export membrane protein
VSWTASDVGRSRGAQIARNALTGAGSRIAMMAVGFTLTPYIVQHLGLRLFALWTLTGSIAGYLGLLDFGLAGVFVKFVTEYVESDRRDLARQVVTFGALFYAGFGVVLSIPVVLLAPYVARTSGLPLSEQHTAVLAFEALALLLVLTLIAGLPGTVVTGMQRMEVASRNGAAAYVVSAIVTVALLHAGWGIAAVVVAGYAQLVVAAALQYRSARRLFGPIWFHPLRCERAVLRRMFSFGGWTQLSQVLTVAAVDGGRFITAAAIGIVSVGYYELASRAAFLTRTLPGYFLEAVMPAAAAADARQEASELDRIYVAGTLYTVFASCGIAGFLAAAADPLIRVWIGKPYPEVSIVLVGLCVGYAFSSVTGAGFTVLRASGRPQYEAYCAGVTAVANLTFIALLAPRYGLAGVAAGSAAGWFVGSIFFTILFHRVHPMRWWKPIGRPVSILGAACVVSSVSLWFVIHANRVQPLFTHRFGGLIALLALAAAFGVVYTALSLAGGVWRDDPSGMLAKALRRARFVAQTGFAR